MPREWCYGIMVYTAEEYIVMLREKYDLPKDWVPSQYRGSVPDNRFASAPAEVPQGPCEPDRRACGDKG
jgi:hypothetical protein